MVILMKFSLFHDGDDGENNGNGLVRISAIRCDAGLFLSLQRYYLSDYKSTNVFLIVTAIQ